MFLDVGQEQGYEPPIPVCVFPVLCYGGMDRMWIQIQIETTSCVMLRMGCAITMPDVDSSVPNRRRSAHCFWFPRGQQTRKPPHVITTGDGVGALPSRTRA